MLNKLSNPFFRSEAFMTGDVALFEEHHVLGTPPYADVEIWLDESLPMDEMVGKGAELVYGRQGHAPRAFRGVIDSIELVQSQSDDPTEYKLVYRIRVTSRLALLGRSVSSEIFQDMDVKEIVSKLLIDHGILAEQQVFRLSGSYPKREYCVRYQESALAFVQRLLESEGITYAVDPHPDQDEAEQFVFFDKSSLAPAAEELESLPIRESAGIEREEESVYGFEEAFRVRSGKVAIKDFDFKRPTLDLLSTVAGPEYSDLEVYDYPGGYFDPADGARLAQVRLEELAADAHERSIESDAVHVRAGRKLVLDSDDTGSAEWFVVSTRLRLLPPESGGDRRLVTEARLIPLTKPYRPPRITPKPVLDGPQTATVMAPEGSEAEEIHTDEFGRCKVRFHWDRSELTHERSSCWIRTGQLQTSGSLALPRIGWEVLVEFLEGDPDRPVVTGRLYNGMFMPPYELPEGRTRTALRTNSTPGGGGSNEIRFEDKAGAEEIAISSQYDTVTQAANKRDRKIANNQTSVIGNNATVDVGSDSKVEIGSGWSHTTKNQSVTIAGNRKLEVNAVYGITTGAASFSVGGNQMEMDGNPLAGLLATVTSAVTAIAAAKAGQVIGQVNAAVQGKVAQALGPIGAVAAQAQSLGGSMQAAANGNLGAALALGPAAAGLPGASALASAIGGGPAATRAAPGEGQQAAGAVSLSGAVEAAVNSAVGGAIARGSNALAAAAFGGGSGSSAEGAGGNSAANRGGPAGDVGGVSEADTATGPGHSQYKIDGPHSETVGSMKVTAAASSINLNVTAALTESVGAAHIEGAIGDRSESVEGAKTESALGLVIVSLGDDMETAKAARANLVGGAMLDKIKGNQSVEAGAMASFIGAMHKLSATSKITLKCGASEIVIDGGGVTLTSPIVTLTGATIVHTKNVADA